MGNARILVTGGCGFVGTNLIEKLYEDYEVSVCDSMQRSSPSGWPKQNILVYKTNIMNFEDLKCKMHGIDYVIHLAAYGSVVESVTNPKENFDVNVCGTFNVLRAAVISGVKRLIFASTGGALIGDAEPPVNEDSLPKPISPYGASKLCGETYCHAFSKSYGLETICLRFANLYGPHSAHKKGAVTTFIQALMNKRPIVIYGDGKSTRDYVYVDDICTGIKRALSIPVTENEVLHIATGRETTVIKLAHILRNIAGRPDHPIEFRNARRGEVARNFADSEKAYKILGFQPKWNLEEGLKKTWDWFQCFEGYAG